MGRQTCDTGITSFYILLQFPQLWKESKSGICDPSTSERDSDGGRFYRNIRIRSKFVSLDQNGSSPVLFPNLGVVFISRTSSLAESASCSDASSSSIQMCVEHVAFRNVAPCSNMVSFNQQHGLKIEEGGRILWRWGLVLRGEKM